MEPTSGATRSKAWVCDRLLAWDCGFEFRRGHGCLSLLIDVYCLCVGLITRPEELYRVWCVK